MPTITTEDQLDEMVAHYLTKPEFAFDVETIGEDRAEPLVATVAWISFACDDRADVIPVGHPHGELLSERPEVLSSGLKKLAAGKALEDLRPSDFSRVKVVREWGPAPAQLGRGYVFDRLRPLFFSDALKIGHNIKFDLHAVNKYLGGYPDGPYYDTMIASWLLDVSLTGRLGLAQCVERELGETLEKGVGKDISLHPFSDVARYSLLDASATYRVKRSLDAKYAAAPLSQSRLLDLEMAVLLPVLEMEHTGVRVDTDRLREIDKELRESIDSLQGLIWLLAGRRFNLNSNKEKQELLFGPKPKGLGLRPLKLTPGSVAKEPEETTIYDYAVDHETLSAYQDTVPLVATMMKYSAKMKLHGTYVLPYLGGESIKDFDGASKTVESRLRRGRIHATFKQNGAESGRFASSNPNLQNVPSRTKDGKKLREIFVPDLGYVQVVADYSQIEPRIVASLSGDKSMIATYQEGGDVYQMVADRMDETRAVGKELVLSITYGVGPETIAARLGCSVTQARNLMEFFSTRFPAIGRHKSGVVSKARARKYSETMMGRVRPLPRIGWSNPKDRASAERQAYNHVIQGSAADIMKIALVNIHASLPDDARMLLTVHDEVVVQTPIGTEDMVSDIVRREMEGAAPSALRVPLVADVHVAKNWAEGKG